MGSTPCCHGASRVVGIVSGTSLSKAAMFMIRHILLDTDHL